jgi:hypothetical protein
MPKCDYAGYFNRIREIERLVIPAENINWLKRYSQPPEGISRHWLTSASPIDPAPAMVQGTMATR